MANNYHVEKMRVQKFVATKPRDINMKLDIFMQDFVNFANEINTNQNKLASELAQQGIVNKFLKSALVKANAYSSEEELAIALEHHTDSETGLMQREIGAPIAQGDLVTVSFKGYNEDGTVNPQMVVNNHNFVVGVGSFIPSMEGAILSMVVGQHLETQIEFPTEYNADVAGKTFRFELDLHKAKTKK